MYRSTFLWGEINVWRLYTSTHGASLGNRLIADDGGEAPK